jgi:hypothetical protein
MLGNTRRSVGGLGFPGGGFLWGWVRTERDPRIASDAGACRFDIFLIISGATRSMMVPMTEECTPNDSEILRY